MTVQNIIDVIQLIKNIDTNYVVEFVTDGTQSNSNCCFYHRIDGINVTFNDVNQELIRIGIRPLVNPMMDNNVILVRNP